MRAASPDDYEHGIRYHAPRRREPGPVVGVAASLLILLVAGQLALASPGRVDGADAAATAPVVSRSELSSEPAVDRRTGAASVPSAGPSPSASPGARSARPSASSSATSSASSSVRSSTPSGTPSGAVAGTAVVELVFESGADTPSPGAADVLDDVAGELLRDPAATVRVTGHAEVSNDRDLERQLSLERALRVVDLLGRRGVPAERVEVVAAGATQADGADDDNRRVTVEVTSG